MRHLPLIGRALERINPNLINWAFEQGSRIPAIRRRIEREYEKLLEPVTASIRPYRGRFKSFTTLPEQGLGREAVLELVERLIGKLIHNTDVGSSEK